MMEGRVKMEGKAKKEMEKEEGDRKKKVGMGGGKGNMGRFERVKTS